VETDTKEDAAGAKMQVPRLTQAARDGAMEAWLAILSQRHPGVVWIEKRALDPRSTRT
jgi:hypothetical protein